MKKWSCFSVMVSALLVSSVALAYPVQLVKHEQRSLINGAYMLMKWDDCTDFSGTGTNATACINPGNVALSSRGMTPSTVLWDWDPVGKVLSGVGQFNSAATGSESSGSTSATMITGMRISNPVIDAVNKQTTADSYECVEGNFLASVGAHGCLNIAMGGPVEQVGSGDYNVGGDPTCIRVIYGPYDYNYDPFLPRGLITRAADPDAGCDATDGDMDLYNIIIDDIDDNGQLMLANDYGLSASTDGMLRMTFERTVTTKDESFQVVPEQTTPLPVLDNARFDPDADLTITLVEQPANGQVVITGSPGPAAGISVSYTSNAGLVLPANDQFVYRLDDGYAQATAVVSILVLNIGANDQSADASRNRPVPINVGPSIAGFDNPVTFSQVEAPTAGASITLPVGEQVTGPGSSVIITYTPADIDNGEPVSYTDTFVYQVTDSVDPSLTSTAEVTVTVSNKVPVATSPRLSLSTQGFAPETRSLPFNAATAPGNSMGDAPSTVTESDPINGTITRSGTSITFVPNAAFYSGEGGFTYTITDGDPDDPEIAEGVVIIDIPDLTPKVSRTSSASLTTNVNTPAPRVGLSITAGNGPLSDHEVAIDLETGGSCAIVEGEGTGNLYMVFTPSPDFVGTGSCRIGVTDADPADDKVGYSTITVNVKQAGGGGGGGGGADVLPGGGGLMDGWLLSLLGAGVWLRRRRR